MTDADATALLEAAHNADVNRAKQLLGDPAILVDAVGDSGNTALNIAVQNNSVELAKVLIEHGANVNIQNDIQDSPYLYAGAEGRTEILTYMLKNARPVPDTSVHNRYGGNTLIPAAEKGHIDNVRVLLADGREDVDFQNNFGYTALIEAVGLGAGTELYQDIVRVLLEGGADQTLKDNSGRNAMDYARERGYTEIVQILTEFQR